MIRPFGFGLAAALVIAALVGGLNANAAKDVTADVAPLIQGAQVPCTVTDSRFIAEGGMADGAQAKFYEVACQEGMGYALISRDKAPKAQAVDCLAASAPGADGKPSPIACKLPANANPAAGLIPLMTKAGRTCAVDKARALGATPTQTVYEISCQGGGDYILMASKDATPPVANPCLAYAGATNIKCTLTTDAQQSAYIDQLVTASGKPCTLKDKRFVGTTPDHADFIEIACTDGKGFMLKADGAGKYSSTVDCVNASGIAGGCTLTDTRQALTEQNATYSDLAKKAGFDCAVKQYAEFQVDSPGKEVVELQCANRPDGGIGVFPAHGTPQVLDCIRAEAEGFKCSFTPESAVYSKLSAQLRAKGRGSCVVSGARAFGRTTTGSDLIEVACADGGPGLVLEYEAGAQQPGSLHNCVQAAQMGAGGCKLPTNTKAG